MNTLATLFCDLVTASDLIADAIVKRTCPGEDEIAPRRRTPSMGGAG